MHVVSYQHQHQHQYQYRVSIFESESESSMTMMSMKPVQGRENLVEWGGRRHRHGHRGERPHAVKPEPWLVWSVQICAMQTPSQVLVVGLLVGLHARTCIQLWDHPPLLFRSVRCNHTPKPRAATSVRVGTQLDQRGDHDGRLPARSRCGQRCHSSIPCRRERWGGGGKRRNAKCEGMRRK